MEVVNFPEVISLIALLLLLVLMVYLALNYKESSMILKRYGDVIKKTMNTEEVKQFISSHKRIRVQVEEDNGVIEIYWVTHAKYPYILARFDKSQNKITGVFSVKTKEDEMEVRSSRTQGGL